jgi:hypothetical protein
MRVELTRIRVESSRRRVESTRSMVRLQVLIQHACSFLTAAGLGIYFNKLIQPLTCQNHTHEL